MFWLKNSLSRLRVADLLRCTLNSLMRTSEKKVVRRELCRRGKFPPDFFKPFDWFALRLRDILVASTNYQFNRSISCKLYLLVNFAGNILKL